MRAAALRLKLRVCQIERIKAVFSSMYNAGTTQFTLGMAMQRNLKSWKMRADWKNWCAEEESAASEEKKMVYIDAKWRNGRGRNDFKDVGGWNVTRKAKSSKRTPRTQFKGRGLSRPSNQKE